MFFNVDVSLLLTVADEVVKQSLTESGDKDFKYLGSWSEQDTEINTRKAQTLKALNQMDKIWKSELLDALKLKGHSKKYVTGLGGRGSSKIVAKCDKGGGGQAKQ